MCACTASQRTAATTTPGRTIQYPLSTTASSCLTAGDKFRASESNLQADIASVWKRQFSGSPPFALTYPGEISAGTEQFGVVLYLEICHRRADTLSFATVPFGK